MWPHACWTMRKLWTPAILSERSLSVAKARHLRSSRAPSMLRDHFYADTSSFHRCTSQSSHMYSWLTCKTQST